ncbi:MAG: hypothetical protein BWY76_01090 [bacterium ADurb.Bin429]|nr:MAG: hypothetical protein BWY76_01090 [bacterium ADurb.Bin429]
MRGLCFLAVMLAAMALAGTVEFGYTEAMKRHWQHEVLSFSVKVPKTVINPRQTPEEREKALAALFVTDENGKPIPAQVSDPVLHHEYESTPLTVTLVADFAPWQARAWMLHYGEAKPAVPATELKATAEKDSYILASDHIAVRTGRGAKVFKTPVNADQVPAPILAVRGPGGAWLGRGWLESPQHVTGYDIALTHDGPIFKRVKAEYTFTGGRYICYVTLRAGEDTAHVREEFDLGDPSADRGSNFCFSLSQGLQPDTVRWYGRYTNIDPYKQFNPTGAEFSYGKMREAVFPIDYAKTQELMRIHGLFVWWPQSAAYFGAYKAGNPAGDLVAIFPERPGHWRNPTVLFLNTTKEKELVLRAPLRQPEQNWTTDGVDYKSPYNTGTVHPGTPRSLGVREWGLLVSRAGEVVPEGDDFTQSGIRRAWTRYGQNPLDKIKEWTLAWNDPGAEAYPRGAIAAADLPALRERAQRIPALKGLLGSALHKRFAYLVTQDKALGDTLVRSEANGDVNWMGILPKLRWSARCYLDTQGDLGINTFMHHGNGHIMGAAPLFDIAMSVPEMTPEERREAMALYAFCMYKLSDPDWLAYGAGFHLGNPNMPTMSMSLLGTGASVIPEHPRAAEWMMTSAKSTLDMLRDYTAPGGAWRECPHYQMDASMSGVLASAQQFKNAGFIDLYQNPFLKSTMLYHAQIMTPVDPRFGIRSMPAIGNTAYETTSLYGRMAAGTAKSDPQYSRWLQWAWQAMGAPYMYPNDEMICNADLPAEQPDMSSRHFPGFGTVMRSHFGTKQETYLLFRMGHQHEHYENEQGEIVFYAKGTPLLMDFGSLYQPMMSRPWLHNRVSLNHKTDWYALGEISQWSLLDSADAAMGSMTTDRLYAVPEDPTTPMPANSTPPAEFITPVTWTRQVMLVKHELPHGPHYAVVRDTLQGTGDDFNEFSLWGLATGVRFNGNTVHYVGQHGVDLTMTVLDPAKPRFTTGQYGHAFLYGPMANPWKSVNGNKKFEEVQHFVRMKRTDHKGYFTVLFPHLPDETPPVFTPWANGAGATAVLNGERHVVICADTPGRYDGNGITFDGQRALVRDGNGKTLLALLAGTALKAGGYGIAAPGPLALTVTKTGITGEANLATAGEAQISFPEAHDKKASLIVEGKEMPLEIMAEPDSLKIKLPKGKSKFILK